MMIYKNEHHHSHHHHDHHHHDNHHHHDHHDDHHHHHDDHHHHDHHDHHDDHHHHDHHHHHPNFFLYPYGRLFPCGECIGSVHYNEISGDPLVIPVMSLDNPEDDDFEADIDYFKSMYPETAKQILKIVEEECDKLEFEGSCMFDDCPDKETLMRMTDSVYEKVKYIDIKSEKNVVEISKYSQSLQAASVSQNWLKNLVEILLLNEIYHRRRRHHHRRRRFY